MARRAGPASLAAALLLGAAGAAGAGLDGGPPPSPGEPPSLGSLPPRDAGWEGLLNQRPDWSRVPLGVGRLGPLSPEETFGTDWVKGVVLPLYAAPGASELTVWLVGGWVVTRGAEPRPLAPDCLLETGPELASLLVVEERSDGWLRLGLAWPCATAAAVWTHLTLLHGGSSPLVFQTWQERLLSPEISPLYFRDPGERHALHHDASAESERVGWIAGDHALEPLAVENDWMRVRVYQPSHYCQEPGTWRGTTSEGWIRWRDPERGPWLWYHTRGC